MKSKLEKCLKWRFRLELELGEPDRGGAGGWRVTVGVVEAVEAALLGPVPAGAAAASRSHQSPPRHHVVGILLSNSRRLKRSSLFLTLTGKRQYQRILDKDNYTTPANAPTAHTITRFNKLVQFLNAKLIEFFI